MDVSNSSQAPRFGINFAAKRRRPVLGSSGAVKYTPGERDELGDNDALGAVDDEGAVGGHHRELAEIDLALLDLARLLDEERGG